MSARVVVTGMGVVSCIGTDTAGFWSALLEGRCGLGPIRRLNLEDFPYRYGGEVDLDRLPCPPGGSGRAARLCWQAAIEATGSLGAGAFDPARAAIVNSTNFGPMDLIEAVLDLAADGKPVPAELADEALPAAPDRFLSKALGFHGPGATLSLSCASGGAAIGLGIDLIRRGLCDVVLAGGYDCLELTSWAGLGVLRVMAATPADGPPLVRPFDLDRSGTLFSEGAAFLLLESAEHARRRGAQPHAAAAGWATNNNAYHMTHADPEGDATAEMMAAALADAGLAPEAVDHINAHGTGTKLNDKIETSAIKTVFGERARRIPVTSIKGTVGHGMGAAGAFEAVATVLAIETGTIPPTIHYRTPDPECDLDIVANTARSARVTAALSGSAGIGGCNAAVVFTAL